MTTRDTNIESESEDDKVKLSIIGDFHYILGAKQFRYRLGTADVIFLEIPDDQIEDRSIVSRLWHGIKNSYSGGGAFRVVLYMIMSVERHLFARSTLIWELSKRDKFREKLVGIDSPEGRDTYFDGMRRTSFIDLLRSVFLLVLLPRSIIKRVLEQSVINDGDKSEEGRLYADEFSAFTASADDSDQQTDGRIEREEYMADQIAEYLAENPDVSEVVVVVGAGHLEPVIKLVDEKVPNANISIANSNIVSEHLESEE